jgi:hypothetical protein
MAFDQARREDGGLVLNSGQQKAKGFQMKWTMFRSAAAMQMEVMNQGLPEFFEYIKNAGPYDSKAVCPWVKLATFGQMRTPKNSLRHNGNVVSISGVEGDYDGEKISMSEGVAMLEKAQVKAIVYSSPSYTDEKPRWRVLAPCSKEHHPSSRNALLARINGALGGILADESFTLSQSYYFGRVQGVEYRIMATFDDLDEGSFVDELDELDDIAIKKVGKAHPADVGDDPARDYSINMFDDLVRMLGRKLKTGDNRREMLKSYIASRSNRGLLRDELISMIEGVVGKYFDPADPIDQANIIGIVDDFVRKDLPRVDQPVDISGLLAKIKHQPTPTQPSGSPDEPVPVKVKKKAVATSAPSYPDPFPGVMEQIVHAANVSAYKPQPGLNLLAALVGMASCINGEYSTASGGRFNVYGIGSLESGGGKDNPRMAAETVAAMGQATILGRPGSGAGLEDALEARKNQLVSIDEIAHILKSMNDDRAPAHVRDIGASLLKLYSAGRGAYNKRILAKGQGAAHAIPTIPNPCVSLIGFATPDGLGDAFNEDNFTDGLLARMLFVPGDPTVIVRRPKHGFNIPSAVDSILGEFKKIDPIAFAGPIASIGSKVVEEAYGISAVMDQLLVDMETKRDKSLTVSSSLYARSFEKMERIAGVLAIWDDPTAPVIKQDHIDWARQMVLASDARLLEFVSKHMHSNDITKHAARIRALLLRILGGEFAYQRDLERVSVEEGRCVARSQLLRVSKLDKVMFDRTLAYMQDLGEVVAFTPNGKPMQVLQDISILE